MPFLFLSFPFQPNSYSKLTLVFVFLPSYSNCYSFSIHFLFLFSLSPSHSCNSKRNRKQRGEDTSQNKERKQQVGKTTRIQERCANFQLQISTFFISFRSKSLLLLFPFSLILNVTHFCFRFFLSQEN